MAISLPDKTKGLRSTVDPSVANFIGLICATAILIAFLFAPWYWGEVKFNGAFLMSNALIKSTYTSFVSLHILLIPLAALVTLLVTVWGLNSPERGKIASAVTVLAGLVGLVYYINFYYIDDNENITKYVIESNQQGNGFWLVLIALIGLIAQVLLLNPAVNDIIFRISKSGGDRVPAIPAKAIPYMFLAIPLLLYFVWIIAPTAYTFYLSLTDWDSVSKESFIGLDNYRALAEDDRFREALGNNVRWFVIFMTVPTTLGLAMAMIFNTEVRGGRWFKVSFYSPLVLSGPVIALVWSWVYHPSKGLLNTLLRDGGITNDPPGWLAERDIAIFCIIMAAVWRQVGYVMILYLAGLKNIDPTLVDAGLVDGTNRWQLFRHVIFPLLAPITTIIIIISIIDSLRAFDLVQVMTRGNQGTEVLANFMYIEAFNNYRMGYGAAIAVVLFSISIFFVGLYLWRALKDELEY
jgi:ABC-type sugar transport system permease subunit